MHEDESEPEKPQFYDVDRFKRVIDDQTSKDPPTGMRLFLVRVQGGLDSVGGFFATLLGTLTVFVTLLVVFIGALYGLLGFLASFIGVVGVLSLYAKRKLGRSMQFAEGSVRTKIIGQLVGCCLVLAAF